MIIYILIGFVYCMFTINNLKRLIKEANTDFTDEFALFCIIIIMMLIYPYYIVKEIYKYIKIKP